MFLPWLNLIFAVLITPSLVVNFVVHKWKLEFQTRMPRTLLALLIRLAQRPSLLMKMMKMKNPRINATLKWTSWMFEARRSQRSLEFV